MTKHKDNPKDPAKVNDAPPKAKAPEDVVHNAAQDEISAEALAGEAIVGTDAPDARKATALRLLPDVDLLALAKRAAEAEHWLDVARRTQADFENSRKRIERENAETLKYVVGSFAKDLLGPVDNLERALAAGEKTPDFKALYEGLKLTQQMLLAQFEKSGLKVIEARGMPFDPNEHEAVMMANDPKLDNNVVAQVFERGWKIHDRVLRPAKVVVNKK